MGTFPHRDMDVYRRAMLAVSLIVRITGSIPSREGWLSRQIRRAVGSVVLNLGEGCGEHSPFEKARIFRISRRSAFEAADGLQLVKVYSSPNVQLVDQADDALVAVASMLTKLALRSEAEGMKKLLKPRKKTCTCPCTCA
jgi:four helix bundle protein